jgi:alpha-1,3-fucosyltransferase
VIHMPMKFDRQRKRSIFDYSISILVCIVFLQIYQTTLRSINQVRRLNTFLKSGVSRPELLHARKKWIQIFLYNDFWGSFDFHIGLGERPFSQCRISRCYITSSLIRNGTRDTNSTVSSDTFISSNMSEYDAIVFHGVNFFMDARKYAKIQKWRQPHHRFVFFMLEPPTFGPLFTSSIYNYFWNWTMTYRLDSDIWRPYGAFIPKKTAIPRGRVPRAFHHPQQSRRNIPYNQTDFFFNVLPKKGEKFLNLAKRPKKVAWVVSNCETPSRRETYVQELRKYIDIDTFGKCGRSCLDLKPTRNTSDDCFTTIKQQYKFYLSLENTFSKDYVTEKFFSRMQDGLLPIVLGQANYSTFAPPHSFINAINFQNPKELANFIHSLDGNNSEYLSYFWWWDHFQVVSIDFQRLSFCDLCAKLHESNQVTKTYDNFAAWWHGDDLDENSLTKLFPNVSWDVHESKFQKRRAMPKLRIKFAD